MACENSKVKISKKVRKKGGKYCVAGGPKEVSCTNSQFTPGISMHVFPSLSNEETTRQRRLWISFVRRHRPNFQATASSFLCSCHFDANCFTTNLEISTAIGMKRRLVAGAVPTIDVTVDKGQEAEEQASSRERRNVS